jgi:hypothetical protein
MSPPANDGAGGALAGCELFGGLSLIIIEHMV